MRRDQMRRRVSTGLKLKGLKKHEYTPVPVQEPVQSNEYERVESSRQTSPPTPTPTLTTPTSDTPGGPSYADAPPPPAHGTQPALTFLQHDRAQAMEIDAGEVKVDGVLNSPVKSGALAQAAEDWTLVDDEDDGACSRLEEKFQVVRRPSDIKMVVSSPQDSEDDEDYGGGGGGVKGNLRGMVATGMGVGNDADLLIGGNAGVSSHTMSSNLETSEGVKMANAGPAMQNEGLNTSVVLVGVRVSVDELTRGEAIGR